MRMLAALWGDAPIGGEGSKGGVVDAMVVNYLIFENAGAHKKRRWAPQEKRAGKGQIWFS